MSRGIIEAQTLRTEQFEFEARTSDPADAQPGEYWFRVDQTSTNPDVIAELRRQDTSGVTTCPIFAASEESNLGTDVTRGPSVVLDDGSVGFIVMTTGRGAVGSPRAVNSAGTQYVSHNALELDTIPDSVIENFEDDTADPAGVYKSGETIADYYNGDTGNYSRTTSDVTEANKAIKAASNAEAVWSVPGDGLNQYPQEGDTLGVLMRDDNLDATSINPLVVFHNVEDSASPSAYGCGLTYNQQIEIAEYSDISGDFDSSKTILNSSSISENAATWYWAEIELGTTSDAIIVFTLYEIDTTDNTRGTQIASVSATDSTNVSQRGIGFGTSNGGETGAFADWLRVL